MGPVERKSRCSYLTRKADKKMRSPATATFVRGVPRNLRARTFSASGAEHSSERLTTCVPCAWRRTCRLAKQTQAQAHQIRLLSGVGPKLCIPAKAILQRLLRPPHCWKVWRILHALWRKPRRAYLPSSITYPTCPLQSLGCLLPPRRTATRRSREPSQQRAIVQLRGARGARSALCALAPAIPSTN